MYPPRRSKKARTHSSPPEPNLEPKLEPNLEPKLEPDLAPYPRSNNNGNPSNPNFILKDYPIIEFRDREHTDRYKRLDTRIINATRFYDDRCITELGIKSDLRNLIDGVGWRKLMLNQHLTFSDLTLEFLSSFQLITVKVGGEKISGVRFRMFNQEFEKNLDDFGEFFGLPRGGYVADRKIEHRKIWKSISGCNDYNPKSSKASRIHNPVLRYLQRLMANTIFARHESQGTVRECELEVIQSMLCPDVQLSAASYIARQFYAVGKYKTGTIMIGGLITPIAVSLGFDLGKFEPIGEIPTLDIPKLVNMRWLEKDGDRFRWVVNNKPAFFLPNPNRTTIQKKVNWVFSDPYSSDGEEENYEENGQGTNQTNTSPPVFLIEQHVGGSSSPPNPLPSLQPSDIATLLASLTSIRTEIQGIRTDIQGIRTEIQGIQTSQLNINQHLDHFNQMLYPIYDWHDQHGHIENSARPDPGSLHPHH